MTLTERQLEQLVSRIPTPKLERRKKPEPKPEADGVVISPEWGVKPTEAVIQDATRGNQALAERMTAEDRRRQQEAKELAELQDARARYQRELDRWQQSVLDVREVLDVRVAGFHDPIAGYEREVEGR